MTRLGRGVNHRLKALTLEQREDLLSIPDVDGEVSKARAHALESRRVPGRVPRRAEEDGPHVVVDAHDLVAALVEILDSLGANEPA